MKIAIIGAHSTGKTSIIEHLNAQLISDGHLTTTLPEYARLCPFPINEATTFDAQQWIQEQQTRQESMIDHRGLILLCDRATIDNFAYFYRAAKLQNNVQDILDWEQRAVEHMKTYDVVFKTTKMYLSAEDDKKRSTNEDFRNEIEILIHELLRKHDIPYIPLPQTLNYSTHVQYILSKMPVCAVKR